MKKMWVVCLCLFAGCIVGMYYQHQGGATLPVVRASAPTHITGKKTALVQREHNSQATRVDQNDPAQYYSDYPFVTWSPSTCSAASMTEVINSYGHHYRLGDILRVEAGLGEITADLGLVEPQGITRTVAQFGFQTRWLSNPTLVQLITASEIHPVIISFPPPLAGGHWIGGHILVVVGGYTDPTSKIRYVHLVDSSRIDGTGMQYMAIGAPNVKGTFLYYWQGFAAVVTPKGQQ